MDLTYIIIVTAAVALVGYLITWGMVLAQMANIRNDLREHNQALLTWLDAYQKEEIRERLLTEAVESMPPDQAATFRRQARQKS